MKTCRPTTKWTELFIFAIITTERISKLDRRDCLLMLLLLYDDDKEYHIDTVALYDGCL